MPQVFATLLIWLVFFSCSFRIVSLSLSLSVSAFLLMARVKIGISVKKKLNFFVSHFVFFLLLKRMSSEQVRGSVRCPVSVLCPSGFTLTRSTPKSLGNRVAVKPDVEVRYLLPLSWRASVVSGLLNPKRISFREIQPSDSLNCLVQTIRSRPFDSPQRTETETSSNN